MRFVQLKAKKRLVYGAIVFIWIAIPAFEITMACLTTDIVKGICAPEGVYSSHAVEQTAHFFGFFVSYMLPLSLMVFCYSSLAYALRPKVKLRL